MNETIYVYILHYSIVSTYATSMIGYYLSHADAEPRNNLGHKVAASVYFLSKIK